MALRDNFHSTVVAWLKVTLPLAALGILSTLFLVSRTVDPGAAIPGAEVDIADRVRAPRLTMPTWAGMTDDGAALTVSADDARPGRPDLEGASAQALRATLDTPDGGQVNVVARSGRMEPDGTRMTLAGNVVVTTSSGYRVTTDELVARMDRTGLSAPGDVAATGPLGTLDAGAMQIGQATGAPESYVIVFSRGVRLTYDPAP